MHWLILLPVTYAEWSPATVLLGHISEEPLHISLEETAPCTLPMKSVLNDNPDYTSRQEVGKSAAKSVPLICLLCSRSSLAFSPAAQPVCLSLTASALFLVNETCLSASWWTRRDGSAENLKRSTEMNYEMGQAGGAIDLSTGADSEIQSRPAKCTG